MQNFKNTIQSIDSDNFNDTIKSEIEKISASELPLQQGLTHSSYVSHSPFKAIILNTHKENHFLIVKAGVFYSGIIAGCSCSDDPSPTDEQNEYCEILFSIDKESAKTEVELLESISP